ncbi:asparaginyl-tRNA synthetase [Dethiosulfatibacter aminovorans DSM 17477]|uniref:Asparagine--tRNA ligase n=1 Tax=Dethiosulfatibacter aminovorans DSM 17477 TaxID=1121476 RepID=A0A1M6DI61_9FIRM|nr:asparagine--tRNA ligase [Dethiosulfatibacter aminovorans]SHI72821.1 asparaginyl-tRNA synthetase [Dethiosulfatibacter aminovorans DSM 17477]
METTDLRKLIGNPSEFFNKEIRLEGWIKTLRASKQFGFIEINDGTSFKNIQVVFEDGLDNFNELKKFKTGAAIEVEGILVETPDAKQDYEVKASLIGLIADCDSSYPLQKKRHTLEYMRTIAHLRPRANIYSAGFRIRSSAAFAVHKFFQEQGFIYVNTPIITSSDAEGAGEMFNVTTLNYEETLKTKGEDFSEDFFGRKTNLTVSGQLEAETFALAYKNVYTFGPTFRAENSNTSRHAAEFWMIEPEMAFTDINGNMDMAEAMIKYIIDYVLENNRDEIEFFNKFVDKGLIERLENVRNSDFERITYTEAVEKLIASGEKFDYKVEWGIDLQTEHERFLTESIYGKPVFVTDYPKEIKAFYMRHNDDNKTVAAMDLLAPGVGEIIGGSQREERHDVLMKKVEELGIAAEELWWYLELRKFGCAYHSGYGLGFERLIMYLTGIGNIRDVIPFPRTPNNAEF